MSGDATAPGLGRRDVLRIGAAGTAAAALAGAPREARALPVPPGAGDGRLRVYVLVLDGCRPEEFGGAEQPVVRGLRAQGTTYTDARSLPVFETIPNHVMMATGVRPDRSGVPANAVYDRAERVVRDLDRPSDLRATTVLEQVRSLGYTSGTVLSKQYLYGIFRGRATYEWEPGPVVVPGADYSPDAQTMAEVSRMVREDDPDLLFVNLGDIDRIGHVDETGALDVRAQRRAALAGTDALVGAFVAQLRAEGKHASSVVILLADHSMDFSIPTNLISVDAILSGRPDLRSSVAIAQNGGADLLYWVGPSAERKRGLAEVRRLVLAAPGVLAVQAPGELRLGPEAGDLVATCRPGWRFSDPTVLSNPIPGNHGHPVTEPIPFLVTGGHPAVRRGVTSGAVARTLDVAPTVGAIFGVRAPRGGYDGRVRSEAFTTVPRAPAPPAR